MASFPSPINYSFPIIHPLEQRSVQTKENTEETHNITKKSFKERFSVPKLERTSSQPQPFQGTCADCISKIEGTVHSTIDNMDFDGLKPFIKTIDLMEKGETSTEEWIVDVQNGANGGICVGMSLAHINNIRDKHSIEGTLAVEKDKSQEFHHAAVIIECQDGLVFIDNRPVPKMRLFSIAFNSTFEDKDFSITVSPRGISPPLIFNWPDKRLEYYTDIANGVDIVNKQFMPFAISQFIPIAVYAKYGKKKKDIIIKPGEARVRLMNHINQEKRYISFEDILKNGLIKELKEFMGSDFHTSPQDANDEIIKFVSHAEELKEMFT